MDAESILSWYARELQPKKLQVEHLKQLKSGSLFMEVMHIHFPKNVDLSKVYLRPKNSFEVSQNYRQLLNTFTQLGWKKIDPEKYVKQQDKDCLDIAALIIRKINQHKSTTMPACKDTVVEDWDVSRVAEGEGGHLEECKMADLERKKQGLLDKLMAIEHIVVEAVDKRTAQSMICKILQQ